MDWDKSGDTLAVTQDKNGQLKLLLEHTYTYVHAV